MATLTLLLQSFLVALWIYLFHFLFDLTHQFFLKKDGEQSFESLDDYKAWIDEQQDIVNDLKQDYKRRLDAEKAETKGKDDSE